MADTDKLVEQQSATTKSPVQTASGMLDTYNQGREQKIRNLYQKSLDNSLTGYRNAYNQSMTEAQRSYDKIPEQYQSSMNQLSAEYERQKRNNNMQAAANGLNTGAGSQMQLGQSMAYQQGQAGLQKQEQQALDTANQGMQDLKTNYQNQIAAASAANDYQLAAALLDEYGQQYERQMTQASQLAEYGDFTMYANIYGAGAAQQMEKTWALQNPLLAYNLGKITAQEYFNMTGTWPYGYSAGGGDSGGGGGGYYGGGGGDNNTGSNYISWNNVMDAVRSGYTVEQAKQVGGQAVTNAIASRQTNAPQSGGVRSAAGLIKKNYGNGGR